MPHSLPAGAPGPGLGPGSWLAVRTESQSPYEEAGSRIEFCMEARIPSEAPGPGLELGHRMAHVHPTPDREMCCRTVSRFGPRAPHGVPAHALQAARVPDHVRVDALAMQRSGRCFPTTLHCWCRNSLWYVQRTQPSEQISSMPKIPPKLYTYLRTTTLRTTIAYRGHTTRHPYHQ